MPRGGARNFAKHACHRRKCRTRLPFPRRCRRGKSLQQGIIVLNTKGTEGGVEELVGVVSKEMEAEGASIGDVQDLGRRKFAYTSNHMESGHYVNYSFTAEPSSLEKIKGRLRLNNQVHLQYFQRKS
ncbi:MAG: 30S ribosomal protein S6 [Verrucomicrobia bacterium]|nr:MAG: 30S ribosomal protein S6 [Verrucomicrobiota bacterium]